MTWPWVSRDAHEIALSAERRRADAEHENAQMLRGQLADLTARYHLLKLQGASEPAPAPAPAPAPTVDAITQAINLASAGKDARVRRGMLKQAKIDKDAGMKEADIIARIHRGTRPAEEVG